LLTVATLSEKKLWQNQLIVDAWIMWFALFFHVSMSHCLRSKVGKKFIS